MIFMDVNLLAVLVAAIAAMVLGFLWYSPMLFAKAWVKEMGLDPNDKARMDEMRKGAGKTYALTFAGSLVSAFVLAKIIDVATVNSALYGMKVGLAVWLGFVATVQLSGMLFEKKSVKLFSINTGYQLVCYLAMGAILAVWPR